MQVAEPKARICKSAISVSDKLRKLQRPQVLLSCKEHTCLPSCAASDPGSVIIRVGTFLRHALLPRTRGNLQRQNPSVDSPINPSLLRDK